MIDYNLIIKMIKEQELDRLKNYLNLVYKINDNILFLSNIARNLIEIKKEITFNIFFKTTKKEQVLDILNFYYNIIMNKVYYLNNR